MTFTKKHTLIVKKLVLFPLKNVRILGGDTIELNIENFHLIFKVPVYICALHRFFKN